MIAESKRINAKHACLVSVVEQTATGRHLTARLSLCIKDFIHGKTQDEIFPREFVCFKEIELPILKQIFT